MSIRVFGNKDKAVMYDGTSEELIGVLYKGVFDAESELNEFVNEFLGENPREFNPNQISYLFTAYKVDKGLIDEEDWTSSVEKAESILNREIGD